MTNQRSAAGSGTIICSTEAEDRIIEKKLDFKWKRGKLIGKGAYGDVYEGFDHTYGRHIAIKTIKRRATRKENIK